MPKNPEIQDIVSNDDVTRIAFLGDSLSGWTGGVDFLRFCISGLGAVAPSASWDLLLPEKTLLQRMRSIAGSLKRGLFAVAAGADVQGEHRASASELKDALADLGPAVNMVSYFNTTAGLARVMDQRGSEVIFPCARSRGKDFPHPWIGYIPDLQHKRLPHFFSRAERRRRDHVFRKLLADAKAVVVNSKAVARDIREFYPNLRARAFPLPFCPPLCREFPRGRIDVCGTYALPDRYFLVSNQFWVHKSHHTAFLALLSVLKSGHDVHLVCTGNMHDYRRPQHLSELKAMIASNQLEKRIHLLGVVPKMHQLMIMMRSVAVVQPTLFEGGPGGGAIYDAVSTCTPAIVSDIDVNREIDIGIVEFFRTGSAEELATKMAEMLNHPPKRMSMEETNRLLSKRQAEFGDRLLAVSRFVARSRVIDAEPGVKASVLNA
jgi:glycosyltransferase involved in cell wall biosynthesis